VKITVERCDNIKVAASQIFDKVKSVALWSANIRKMAKNHKGYGSAARCQCNVIIQIVNGEYKTWTSYILVEHRI
jgi:hypothetical protein